MADTDVSVYYEVGNKQVIKTCFSANLESVWKDVKFVFGILKGRFSFLDCSFKHCQLLVCEKVFVACCVLLNMMLDEMKRETPVECIG